MSIDHCAVRYHIFYVNNLKLLSFPDKVQIGLFSLSKPVHVSFYPRLYLVNGKRTILLLEAVSKFTTSVIRSRILCS